MNKKRVIGVGVVVLVAAVVLLVVKTIGSGGRPYNVLLITLDTTRADRLGCYGHGLASTPALDELAENGVLFEQAICAVPLTLPSHATMLTGFLPPEHRLRINGVGRLASGIPTLAGILRGQGYATGAFIAAFVLDSTFGLDRGFETYDDDLSNAYEQKVKEPLTVYRAGNLVTDSALNWLKQRDDRPFFCWVHLYDPHTPYYVHEALSGTRYEGQISYDAEVAFMDMQVARLLAFLDEQDLLKPTLVIAVGDHGEGLGEHGEPGHGYMVYETTLRVPLIFSQPGEIRQGQRVRPLVSLVDLFPTLLDLLDLPLPGERMGRSLKPALLGDPIDSIPCYSETRLPYDYFRWSPLCALTTPEWKYIRTARAELFDRQGDPRELGNLAGNRPDLVDESEMMLAAMEEQMVPQVAEDVELTAEAKQQLAAIGYIAVERDEDEVNTASLDLSSLKDIKDMRAALPLTDQRRALMQQEKTAELVEVCRELVRLDPDSLRFRCFLADALANDGQFAEAAEHYRVALQVEPDSAPLHETLGRVLSQDGQFEGAIPYLRKALLLDPNEHAARSTMAYALLRLGRIEDAIAYATEVLRIDPQNEHAAVTLAAALVKAGRIDQAMPHFTKVLGDEVNDPGAHYNLANTLDREGRTEVAITHYTVALWLDPQFVEAHYNLANVMLRQGKPDDAAKHYSEVLRLRPDYPEAHNNLALALYQQGNVEKAIVHCTEALRLKPDYADAYVNLGIALTQQGKIAQAMQAYGQALQIQPLDPGTRCNLADLLVLQGRLDDAIDAYREALRTNPDHERSRRGLQAALAQRDESTGSAPASQPATRWSSS